MSDIIQLLPDSVANQIAAGEVIQRPASVVKELVENALDAGARHIDVIVMDAGRTSIQVIDDGKGMSPTDARLSFERHATSKIQKAEDLFDLHTMGFRGEALASIAAVAQVELRTRRQEDEIGTLLTLSGSKFSGQEPVSCPVGSSFKVENLFFNVPARRRFLKTNVTELNNIITVFERMVLVNPQVSFTLHSNGVQLMDLPVSGLRQRILAVYGKRINQDLLPVEVETSVCRISGFVGKPESSKKKGAHQFFFVNGRFMKHPYFGKAVMAPFERLVPQGEQVPYFIYFDVAPSDIDVNIHPTKTEIKFDNEQAIWQILSAAVKETVGKFNDVPQIDFDTEGRPDIPVFSSGGGTSAGGLSPKVAYNPQYNPFKSKSRSNAGQDEWESLYPSVEQKPDAREQDMFAPDNMGDDSEATPASEIVSDRSPVHYQYKGRYIMTAVKSGLMIIDQHRAHVRVLYEEYMKKVSNHSWMTQNVLFPEVVELCGAETEMLRQMMPQMSEMGFSISDLGGGSFSVNGIPAGLESVNASVLLRNLVVSVMELSPTVKEQMESALALDLARHAAIPTGQLLSNEEMENLVNNLFLCGNVSLTPDGKPILCILKQSEIEYLLG
jgi:DNA mismatch repair protein MutL